MKWYVLQVTGGREKLIVKQLHDLGIHALAPSMEHLIRSKGEWITKEYMIFGGYVFVETEFCARAWYQVNKIPDVIRWLGDQQAPSSITYMEAEWIRLLGNGGKALPASDIRLKEDGSVEVLSGALLMFKNKMLNLNKRQKRCEVDNPIETIGKSKIKFAVNIIENETGEQGAVDSSCEIAPADIRN